jgi:threonine synthase
MLYKSTRSSSIAVSFEEAICSGYAADGGLLVPATLPRIISATNLLAWKTLSYPLLTATILRYFICQEEISDTDLHDICSKSFQTFSNASNAVPVVPVVVDSNNVSNKNVFVAELFHGPTFCFKDFGMQVVIHLLSYFCSRRHTKISLIVSTTGDTGPAAVRAVNDVHNPRLTLLVHYPLNQISAFQRKQMTTTTPSKQVRVVAFEGGGDDMDDVIKDLLSSNQSTVTHDNVKWTGVNSYNIGRPLMQLVHYVWTYLRVIEERKLSLTTADPLPGIDFIVPTGAMGNIVAGYMAKNMGLPIHKLVAAVNVNDIVHRAFSDGDFSKSETMHRTLSEAINIQTPYNFERLLFYLTNENHELVKQWMETVEKDKALALDAEWLEKLQRTFESARVSDDEMCATMRKVYKECNYWIDPHTAVAFCAAYKLGYDVETQHHPLVAILATASPCKFRESLEVALGESGWLEYETKGFPPAAQQILERAEVPPIEYKAKAGASLIETQAAWGIQARSILKEMAESKNGDACEPP